MLSFFSHVQLCATVFSLACQVSLSMGFSWHESWSGLSCPPPWDLSDLGSNLSLLCLLHWQEGSQAWLSIEGGSGSMPSSQPQSNFSVFLVQNGSRENRNIRQQQQFPFRQFYSVGLGIVPGHLALSLVLQISSSPVSFSLSF